MELTDAADKNILRTVFIKQLGVAMDQIGAIIEYEQGELDEDQIVELFQSLLDSGLVWQLQGHYGRMAVALLNQGRIVRKS